MPSVLEGTFKFHPQLLDRGKPFFTLQRTFSSPSNPQPKDHPLSSSSSSRRMQHFRYKTSGIHLCDGESMRPMYSPQPGIQPETLPKPPHPFPQSLNIFKIEKNITFFGVYLSDLTIPTRCWFRNSHCTFYFPFPTHFVMTYLFVLLFV